MKKSLYVVGFALLAVPAVLYLNGHLQEDLISLINKDIAEKPTAAGEPAKKWKSGQILVKPKAGLSDAEFDAVLGKNQGKVKEKIGNLPVHIISVPENAEEAVVRALSKNPHIEFAELDMVAELDQAVVNDPNYATEWHLPKIQAPEAWDIAKGQGITIAILDTGVDGNHPDLANQMVPGYNAVTGSLTTADIYGHGTKVAGSAAAITNNAVGVASVAGDSKIMPVKVNYDDAGGSAYTSDIARGLDWASANGADVANISYAMTASATVATAGQAMRNKGGIVFVSAGNDGKEWGFTETTSLVSVSATDSNDAKASWSSYGNWVDIAAPGVSILTTTKGGGYGSVSGTSFSSPIAAGVAALVISANPNLTPDQIETVIENSADKVAGVNFHPYFGYGRVNASAAVQLALNTKVSDTEAPVVNIFSPRTGSTVSGLVPVDVSASDNESVSQVSLYANGDLIGTDTISPYQFSWDSAGTADGSLVLTATAVDGAGNQASSANVSVTVKNQATVTDNVPPSVAISNPANNATVSGLVAIGVSADDDIAVAKVELYIDGKLTSSAIGSNLNYKWNTKKVKSGSHSIQAIATDTSNKTSNMIIQVKN